MAYGREPYCDLTATQVLLFIQCSLVEIQDIGILYEGDAVETYH